MKNIFVPTIEWHKHQKPGNWIYRGAEKQKSQRNLHDLWYIENLAFWLDIKIIPTYLI